MKTADGKAQAVVGKFNANITWRGKTVEMVWYLVPSLQQKLYLGIDFWDAFGVAPAVVSGLDVPDTSQIDLSAANLRKLERVKKLFPSFLELGLGMV